MKHNDGFYYARREVPIEQAEQEASVADMSPHEKGEFRKAYWQGRVNRVIQSDLQGCVRYMNMSELKVLHRRLDELFKQTLADMYGEEGMRKFLEETGYPKK